MANAVKILLVGSSYMAEEYLKVLSAFKADVLVVGRDEEKARSLAAKYGYRGMGGGVQSLKLDSEGITHGIVASSVESLKEASIKLVDSGIQNILVEKPGAMTSEELVQIKNAMKDQTFLRIAYNRLFYNSVSMLRDRIQEDGGPVGCFFDFTDREKDILGSKKNPDMIKRWGFSNSTHVISTAFSLIGNPVEMNCSRSGSWSCHPSGTVFAGHGRSEKCLFSYFATWNGGGRWNVEVSTVKGRYKLSPLEELQFCAKNQFEWQTMPHEDSDDKDFKPGLKKMLDAFMHKRSESLLFTIDSQIKIADISDRIFGYK